MNKEQSEDDLQQVTLEERNFESDVDVQHEIIQKKCPKRILHFSDGVLEEYSSEDEVDAIENNDTVRIDPKTLNWLPWTWYKTTLVGSRILEGCDYLGECLASFFGITSPKYQYEIDEYNRIQAIQAEASQKIRLETGGWNDQNKDNLINTNNAVSQV